MNSQSDKQVEDIRMALLIRDGVVIPGAINKTALITANGFVSFTNGYDMTTGMKFTHEQWREIVDFVEGQITPIEPVEERKAWEPDWSIIDEEYNYFAIDSDGKGTFFESGPKPGTYEDEWISRGGDFMIVYRFKLPLSIDWKDTLCTRPGVSL